MVKREKFLRAIDFVVHFGLIQKGWSIFKSGSHDVVQFGQILVINTVTFNRNLKFNRFKKKWFNFVCLPNSLTLAKADVVQNFIDIHNPNRRCVHLLIVAKFDQIQRSDAFKNDT